jgi:hypothetical protein
MSKLATLIDARNKIEEGFTHGQLHSRIYDYESGKMIDAYCTLGAVKAAAGSNPFRGLPVLNLLRRELFPTHNMDKGDTQFALYRYNDTHTKEEVLRVFDRTIKQQIEREHRLSWLARKVEARHNKRRLALDTPPPVIEYTDSGPEPGDRKSPGPGPGPQPDPEMPDPKPKEELICSK